MATLARSQLLRSAGPAKVSSRARKAVVTKAELNTALTISASTAAMLAVGRIAFLPQQRKRVEAANTSSGPKTTGTTYFDSLQQDASFIQTTNDPDGFNLVDLLAWGALGHALGFAILAASSSGVIPGVSGQ